MSQRMSPLDPIRRAANWSLGEVLNLTANKGEEWTIAKGMNGNRQNHVINHQDCLQIWSEFRSLTSQYVRGREANKVSCAARTPVLYHENLAQILKKDHGIAPHHTTCCMLTGLA